MVQFIVGEKGKGKSKYLLNLVEENLKTAEGNSIYIDDSNKYMYTLSRKVRLINFKDYEIKNHYEALGFIAGCLALDHDIEYVYFDNFRRLTGATFEQLDQTVMRMEELSRICDVKFIAAISGTRADFPEAVQKYIAVEL